MKNLISLNLFLFLLLCIETPSAKAEWCQTQTDSPFAIALKSELRLNGQYSLKVFKETSARGKTLNKVVSLFRKTLKLDAFGKVLYRIERRDLSKPYFNQLIQAFDIKTKVSGKPFAQLDKNRPLVLYANHPLFAADGFAIAAEIEKVRPDVKVVANQTMKHLPGFKDHAFFVKNDNSPEAKIANKAVLEQINEHLRNNGCILIFPSGAISQSVGESGYAVDLPWKSGIVRFAEQTPATVLNPIFVVGEPSVSYLKARKNFKFYSEVLAARGLANQINTEIELVVGEDIPVLKIANLQKQEKLDYLRGKLYEMGTPYFNRKMGNPITSSPSVGLTPPLLSEAEYSILKQVDQVPE